MRTPRRVAPPANLRTGPLEPRRRFEYNEADLGCYLCGSTVGTARWSAALATPRLVTFAPAGTDSWETAVVSHVRCQRCGGQAYVEEVHSVRRTVEQVDWTQDRPRRGRPPQWLVELRQQAA